MNILIAIALGYVAGMLICAVILIAYIKFGEWIDKIK